jgi:hypothetical protein
MRKFKHIELGKEFTTELLGCYKIEGIKWKDLEIPLWVVEDNSNWQEVVEQDSVFTIFATKKNKNK